MQGMVEKGRIRVHEQVGPEIWRMLIELPRTASMARPGQFIHVKIPDASRLLRRPISISGTDPGKGLVEIIYRVVGGGTRIMSEMKIGDTIDSLGPLGSSFSPVDGEILGVGGGVGIAPILFMARRAKPGQMTVIIGGRNRDEVFWKDLFPDTLKKLIVTTDDGSYGIKGFTVSAIPDVFKKQDIKRTIVCGPAIMMRKTAELSEAAGIDCEVSMERRMGCGTGTCMACVCDRRDGNGHYKVCLDGPVFNSKEVIL
jgi:dihydroorotate dehydrogenase electron transfer subunit